MNDQIYTVILSADEVATLVLMAAKERRSPAAMVEWIVADRLRWEAETIYSSAYLRPPAPQKDV